MSRFSNLFRPEEDPKTKENIDNSKDNKINKTENFKYPKQNYKTKK